jgi:uncharacterized RDD family membrane protein YckC
MRCPKCHYLSFEPEPRCRNCGFDLETHDPDPLMADADPVIKNRDAEGPLVDLDLRRPAPGESRPASLGAMRPVREADAPRPGGYRPPAPRQPEPIESRPRPAGVALEDRPRPQPPRPVSMRPEAVRPARPEFSREDMSRAAPTADVPRPIAPRVDVPRPRFEPPRVDAPRVDAPRVVPPKIDAPKVDAPRVDAPRVDAPRVDAPRVPPERPEVAPKDPPKRPPQTTSDLPLFLKRLPDPEPEPIITEPKIERPVDPPIARHLDPPIARHPDPTIATHLDPPIEPVHEPVRTADPIAAAIDRPLVKVPQEPRAPLSVRRPAEAAKTKPEEPAIALKRPGAASRDLLDDLQLRESDEAVTPRSVIRRADTSAAPQATAEAAGPVGRVVAAVLDAVFLAGVGTGVLWVLLRAIDLTLADVPALPFLVALPLATFVLLIYLGYLLLFTAAGGQTLGKMATNIRVVGTSLDTGEDERLSIQRAAFRSLLTLPSVFALGAGFMPALVGEHKAVHDRIAQTRVVRV